MFYVFQFTLEIGLNDSNLKEEVWLSLNFDKALLIKTLRKLGLCKNTELEHHYNLNETFWILGNWGVYIDVIEDCSKFSTLKYIGMSIVMQTISLGHISGPLSLL